MEFSFAELQHAIGDAYPDRVALVSRAGLLTWRELTERSDRLAHVLHDSGVGLRGDPDEGMPWDSPHAHVALYLHNSNAYLEGMLGSWSARACATNINYRYVEDELAHVLGDQQAAAIIYHGCFAARLGAVLERIERPALLLRVDDGSGEELLPGALDYEAALASVSAPGPPRTDWSPSDRYILYTGGTTGAPKGVLWRQDDIMVRALGLARKDGSTFSSVEDVVLRAEGRSHLRSMPLPPFMHGAAHWNALSTWLSGGTVVLPDDTRRLDAHGALASCEAHDVTSLLIVGDAFARPLIDALESGAPRPSALRTVLSSGAILSRPLAESLQRLLGDVRIMDVLGSSESGRQGINISEPGGVVDDTFRRDDSSVVLSEDRSRTLATSDDETGWLAAAGRVPLGYLGDPAKTAATFPTIDGVRYSVPGDRARWRSDGRIELFGRDSSTINSGGEKIFAEEVERALKEHPAVDDALVVGRPSERWGNEVAAVVATRAGQQVTEAELVETAGTHLARYKLPKAITFVAQIPRSPSGKPDYPAARALL